jgi:O-antigen/teichoic acid export membrane protein
VPKLDKYDQPIVFAITVTLIVVGMIAVWSWFFMAMGWTGPLSVLKGGYVDNSGTGVNT